MAEPVRTEALFGLNRRIFKPYLLKESREQLSNYSYAGAMTGYLKRWINQLKWQRPSRCAIASVPTWSALPPRTESGFESRRSWRRWRAAVRGVHSFGPGALRQLQPWHDKKTHKAYLNPEDGKWLHYYV